MRNFALFCCNHTYCTVYALLLCIGKGESESDLHFEVAIPPSMPALAGYASLHRTSLDSGRQYASHQALSSYSRNGDDGEEADPETVSLLTADVAQVLVTGPRRGTSPLKSASIHSHAWSTQTQQPFSALLGKQTQV